MLNEGCGGKREGEIDRDGERERERAIGAIFSSIVSKRSQKKSNG